MPPDYHQRIEPTEPLHWPPSAVPAWHHPEGRAYLQQRNLSREEADTYALHYADSGIWRQRILIPCYGEGGELSAFQGRHIHDEEPRYRTAGPRPIYVIPSLRGEASVRTLCVVEGPFDCFAVARIHPVVATLGILPSARQIYELLLLLAKWKTQRALLWYDQGASAEAFALQMKLNPYVPTEVVLDDSAKDPGELPPRDVARILTAYSVACSPRRPDSS